MNPNSPPKSRKPRDDEMSHWQYEHPPGLMPRAPHEYDCIRAGGEVTIYEIDDLADTRIKSDVYVPVMR